MKTMEKIIMYCNECEEGQMYIDTSHYCGKSLENCCGGCGYYEECEYCEGECEYEVDLGTIELAGIDMNDYPKFCDAYIEYAEDTKGRQIPCEAIEKWSEENQDIINELVHEKIR